MITQILKCPGHNCPLKENCLRFVSNEEMYGHTYLMDVPYDQESNTCDLIIDKSIQIEMKDISI